tara:strand:+ start:500 stop:919 length:420 start_codon:yes stop_codon:yes gene_type:complete
MFKFFKDKKNITKNNSAVLSIACLLIHAAKIDENYSQKEKEIIKKTLIKLGADISNLEDIITKAEEVENNSIQLLEFTKEAKNLEEEDKLILIEALWTIVYSDENVDMYEANLMRRLSGLLYLNKKVVGDIKEKIKDKK